MSNDQVLTGVAGVIRRAFRQPDAEITRETVAMDIDGWDSLSHTILILDIEKHFKVKLPADKVYDLADVGELVDLVVQARSAA